MPRIKVARKSTVTDMTAMCDVAFLLLTFFIMTAKFKQADPVPVAIPAYSKVSVVPEDHIATLIIGKDKVFFGVENVQVRAAMLDEVGKIYSTAFTPDEKKMFITLPNFGVPINMLKQYLDLDPDQMKKYPQTGIPVDTTNNSQLFNWVREARKADLILNNKPMRITIKCDSKEAYPTVGKVIAMLQKQKVNKFSLITTEKAAK